MSSEQLADGVNPLDAELAATWDVLKGYSGRDTDLGIGRRFGGATMAFSLRDIGAMNGAVIRVRRDTGGGAGDDDEEDFSANQISSGALESWVGSGNNGYVSIWYDQSGNGFHLRSQSTDTQPFIVQSGTLTNGVYSPTSSSNSTKKYLEVSSPDFDCTDITSSKFGWLAVMANMEENINGGAGVIFGNTKNTQTYPTGAIGLQLSDTNEGRMFVMNSRTGTAADFIGAVDDTDLFDSETIGTAVVDGSSLNTFLNGNTGSGTFTSLTLTSAFNFKIFQSTSSVGGLSYQTASQGFIKELMFMQGDTIDDIATIRNEVNNHYNIF